MINNHTKIRTSLKMNERRKILKCFGHGLVWTTPVVTSIILPSHAQISEINAPSPPAPISYALSCNTKLDLLELGPVTNNEQTFILNITSSASATASDGSPVNTMLNWTITYPGNFTMASGVTNMVNGSASITHSVTFNSFAELIAYPVDVNGSDATITYRFTDQTTYGGDVGICAPFD